MLEWSGATKRAIDLQFRYGFAFFDRCWGFRQVSSEWGASRYSTNASGTALLSPGITVEEQRITKIFFSLPHNMQYRPNVLGSSLAEQILRITMDKPIGFQFTLLL
jgi:hypothetical protein